MSTRRSTRSTRSTAASADSTMSPAVKEMVSNEETEEEAPKAFTFDNVTFYATYAEMVAAKRQRNQNMLISSGLLDAKAAVDASAAASRATASSRGIKRSSTKEVVNLPRRKSGRLAGQTAPNLYVEDESGGRIVTSGIDNEEAVDYEPQHYKDRINDGSPLSIEQAVNNCESKWINDDGTTLVSTNQFVDTLNNVVQSYKPSRNASPTTVTHNLQRDVDALSLDDEANVSKVVPDRIYSVACHPSTSHLVVCAGDKQGYLGLWNVDQYSPEKDTTTEGTVNKKGKISSTDGVHLFKPHSRPISTLAWNESGSKLLSCSYDGTVRAFDVEKQVFQEIFATYDDSEMFKDKIGYGLDNGYKSWVQCMELDRKHGSDGDCFFLSTSEGTVMHIDLRTKGEVTFDQALSEKKINTVSLHPNGFTMATAGLDTTVKLWDVRKLKTSTKIPNPVATQNAGKSVNSAFFSPSGKRIITTTMSNTLDILEDAHLASGLITKPASRIRHDNHTGRWLCTFMARWHPSTSEECFVVGSMQQPRTVEVFSGDGKLIRGIQGDSLTAVASRCCFHPNADRLIVVGGNSSGRVTVAHYTLFSDQNKTTKKTIKEKGTLDNHAQTLAFFYFPSWREIRLSKSVSSSGGFIIVASNTGRHLMSYVSNGSSFDTFTLVYASKCSNDSCSNAYDKTRDGRSVAMIAKPSATCLDELR
ncbi:hypothetical protein ACHAWO_010264 [Cyclotella atomus]|uniref:WD repeat-containing protein 76 n=1 Tax=Cyclotella atomus TaxID=382360 RepID=A0ABD3PA34_9STRA